MYWPKASFLELTDFSYFVFFLFSDKHCPGARFYPIKDIKDWWNVIIKDKNLKKEDITPPKTGTYQKEKRLREYEQKMEMEVINYQSVSSRAWAFVPFG